MTSFILNERLISTGERPGLTVLEFVRDVSCLSGTKEACREGECGACTVLVGSPQPDGSVAYRACASCLLPLGDVEGCHVVTVEGLAGAALTLVQKLIVEHSASQCGFCTPGIVLSLTGFCLGAKKISFEGAVDALDGNICRCTGYVSIRNAARALCASLAKMDLPPAKRLAELVNSGVVPGYFKEIPARLSQFKAEPAGTGSDAVLVAGGTDLFVQKPEQLLEGELCFLSKRRDLDYVKLDGEFLRVGGAVTIEDFRQSPPVRQYFPALEKDFLLHSSAILRNKATLAGNVVNASPIGDATIILLALDARLVISGNGARREVPLSKFYLGYKKTDLACGELVSEIVIPLLPKGARYHFEKVSNRTTLDIAAVNSALRVTTAPDGTVTDLRISAGGVAAVPVLLALESFKGRKLDAPAVEALAKAAEAEARPIDDIRGSAAYKKLLLGRLVGAHFAAAAGEAV
ncbi:MAG: FAD binding domain-containing protein [Elusimicrobiales bacterium]|nr:FAD binding domain-containing protein [Elusimicrobiales bacterium]